MISRLITTNLDIKEHTSIAIQTTSSSINIGIRIRLGISALRSGTNQEQLRGTIDSTSSILGIGIGISGNNPLTISTQELSLIALCRSRNQTSRTSSASTGSTEVTDNTSQITLGSCSSCGNMTKTINRDLIDTSSMRSMCGMGISTTRNTKSRNIRLFNSCSCGNMTSSINSNLIQTRSLSSISRVCINRYIGTIDLDLTIGSRSGSSSSISTSMSRLGVLISNLTTITTICSRISLTQSQRSGDLYICSTRPTISNVGMQIDIDLTRLTSDLLSSRMRRILIEISTTLISFDNIIDSSLRPSETFLTYCPELQ